MDPNRHAPDLRRSTTDLLSGLLDGPPAVALTSSCTHALEAAALLTGVGPGDEVVVPAFAFSSTANPFLLRGATLRFADVDLATGNVSPASVAERTGERTRAVVCVHYGGVAADLDALCAQADAGGWDLVEDAAHGLFARHDGVPLGRFGRLGALSFHRTKNISAHEGGALVVNDPTLVGEVEVLLDKGTNRTEFDRGLVAAYEWRGPGSAWRLADPLVAQLADELGRREQIQAARHRVWDAYARELAAWAAAVGAALPVVDPRDDHPAHLFWVLLPRGWDRDELTAHGERAGVPLLRHYGSLPDTRYGRTIARPEDRCPNAAALAERLVRLPVWPELTDGDVDRVLAAVTSFRPGCR